jgi:hypothetical protein
VNSRFTSFLVSLIKLSALTCVGVLCAVTVYSVFSVATSRRELGHVLWAVGLESAAYFIWRELPPEKDQEDLQLDVMSDHLSISSWVLECMGIKRTTSESPYYIADMFLVPKSDTDALNMPQEARTPNHQEHALVQLSKLLSQERIVLRKKAKSAYVFWQTTTVITIFLGMFTTILVSMSSTEFGRGDGNTQRLIRILAIVFPALGTAAAAVFAFYGPQAEWSQASRTLASITQLHG